VTPNRLQIAQNEETPKNAVKLLDSTQENPKLLLTDKTVKALAQCAEHEILEEISA